MANSLNHIICFCFLLFCFAEGAPAPIAGPPEGLSIEIKASKPGIVIGDSLSIFCTVTLPDSVQAGEPYLKDKSLFIDTRKQWTKEEKTPAGIRRTYGFLTYILSADTLKVGPFVLDFVTGSGRGGEALSNVLEIRSAGVAEKADAPPKPNRAPLGIPAKGFPGWLLLLILPVLASALAWYILKRRKKKVSAPAIIEPLDEVEEFERIRALHLLESGQVKELYLMVSTAMRGFIHRNMGFEAMYSTTEEIKRTLARQPRYGGVADSFREIFEESDMVKFAKYIPPVEISSTVIDRAEAPVRKVLEQIALEKERARIAAEETKRRQAAQEAPDTTKETVSAPGGEH
ncbi:MAG: hypothetical protein Q8O92_12150 [Candidatus Latescibacter sp.]|nr:hypothetical protein [Candidatus Latescibacter sp.]